jgi:putative CocE/NonD family hydrolase
VGYLVGHDNGQDVFDRAIAMHDVRFAGTNAPQGATAVFAGAPYTSALSSPPLGRWMQVVGVWNQEGPSYVYRNTVRSDGQLTRVAPGDDPPDHYTYDPRDPVMSLMGRDIQMEPRLQAPNDDRQDILVYQTPPLENPLRVIGRVSVRLWVASDAPDTDFTAKLIDVRPDGSAVNITYGILRCRYREGYATEADPLRPGQVYEIEIALNPTAIVFGAGHRIRLDISSSDFPNFDRNHNTGRDFWSDTELRPARQTVFHDRNRPSRLILPVTAFEAS